MILEFPFFPSTSPAITCNDRSHYSLLTTTLDYKDIATMHTYIDNYAATTVYCLVIMREDMSTITITCTSLAVSRYYFNCIYANAHVRESTIRTLFPEIFI